MSQSPENTSKPLAFNGYHRKQTAEPDWFLCQVGRGTPGGEYLRRFWQPVAYVSELGDVPLRVFARSAKTWSPFATRAAASAFASCIARIATRPWNTASSKEKACAAVITVGFLMSMSMVLEIPGEPAVRAIAPRGKPGCLSHACLWRHPLHLYGAAEDVPVFPLYDRFNLPGIKLVPGPRWALDCNWIQIKENAVDPHHTQILHVIPQLRGMDHFSNEFGNFPELTWTETPGGVMYVAARRVGENVWLRSARFSAPISTPSARFSKAVMNASRRACPS